MVAPPLLNALDLVEDALLAALIALGPAAAWDEAPAITTERLRRPAGDPQRLSRFFILQHQDNGGQIRRYVHSAGWTGLVAIRCLADSRAAAAAGRTAAWDALGGLTPPAGYALHLDYAGPLPALTRSGIHQRGLLVTATIRRLPAP